MPIMASRSLTTVSSGVVGGTGIADQGTIWYASPSGSGAAFTLANPGSLANAINSATTPASPGDTIKLRGGTYTGVFTSSLAGSIGSGIDNPDGKIIVKPYQNEQVILDPGTNLNVGILTIGGNYTWYVGLEAAISNFTGRDPTGSEATTGIQNDSTNTQGIKIIGNTIHDVTNNCLSMFNGSPNVWDNSEVHGCVLYFAGETPQAGPNYAYPIYTQNSAGYKKYYRNAIFCGFGNYPIHCYGTVSLNMIGMDFQYNSTIGGLGGAGSWNLYKPDDSGTGTWNNNNLYSAQGSTDGVLDLGYFAFNGGCTDTICHNNNIRGKVGMSTTRPGMSFTGNNQYGDQANFLQSDFPTNNYFSSSPGANWVSIVPYNYIRKAGLVSIFNFTSSTSLAVDLSSILSVNDTYEVIDIQNRFGSAITTGTYAGGTVSLSLTSTAVATPRQVPQGRSAPSHTTSEFNCFLVRATPYKW